MSAARSSLKAVSLLLLVLGSTSAAKAADEAQRALHLLDYIAVDYAEAVHDGRVVNELEYREQLEFAARARELLARLESAGKPGVGGSEAPSLDEDLARLEARIGSRAPAPEVASSVRALARKIRHQLGVHAVPLSTPSIEHGTRLYAEACAACHGPTGKGDGPAAKGLDPPPRDFTERHRALAMSPSALYQTIALGIEGTAMVGFADRFDSAALYDLAFFVGSLAFRPDQVARGSEIAATHPERLARWVPSLSALVEQPASSLVPDGDPEGEAVVAYLRTHPAALQRGGLPVDMALNQLARSWGLYNEGHPDPALDLAVSAYLDGFEPVEPALDSLDGELRVAIETGFVRYREGIRAHQTPDELRRVYAELRGALSEAAVQLGQGGLGTAAVFTSALVILAREGLEAMLILVAIATVMLRAGHREALPYFHAGWAGALVAGGLTWGIARFLVEVSGAQREVIEGLSSLLAMGILFYVSYWLLSRIEAARWQRFLDDRVKRALSRGSLWTLASVTFVALYRELFETILFLEALWAQAEPQAGTALGLGVLAGLGVLGFLAVTIYHLGVRVPLRRFFAVSSGLLYLLAFVLAGQGIAALQEAGWLPSTWVGVHRIEWLGIYPTLEGLALQGLLLLAAAAAVPWSLRRAVAPLAALALLVGPSAGCAPKLARVPVIQNEKLTVLLRQRVSSDDASGSKLSHPATISPIRLASILARIDARPKGGSAHARQPAIPSRLLFDVAQGISTALARAAPDQEVVVMARRRERHLKLFTRERLTSLITFVRGDRLEIYLSRIDWPIPSDPGYELREPRIGERAMGFRLLPTEGILVIGPQAVAALWRDPLFRDTSVLKRGPRGQIRRRTILMESPEEPQPLAAPREGRLLSPETRRALEALEQARRSGQITEAEYQARREEILSTE